MPEALRQLVRERVAAEYKSSEEDAQLPLQEQTGRIPESIMEVLQEIEASNAEAPPGSRKANSGTSAASRTTRSRGSMWR